VTEIALQNPRGYQSLQTSGLQRWLRRVLAELAPDAVTFGLRFVHDDEIKEMNCQFRGQDVPTDVLSFPGGESTDGLHLGDVVISVPTAREQAEAGGVSEQHELRCLLIHGLLHCLGYDHQVDGGEMDRFEQRLRERWLSDVD